VTRTLAAVDLGSNSFHLVVARVVDGMPVVVDRLRERVVLAAGLDRQGRLEAAAEARALACLTRFGQRLRGVSPDAVRAVGTNALRQARNASNLLRRGQAALGHPIEVISGQEEARLIYQGVAHDLARDGRPRLVVDIGGGSTECIVGRDLRTLQVDSLFMGCVSWTLRHFPDGRVRARDMHRAVMAAALEVEPLRQRYRALGWQQAVGSSGTILAIEEVLREEGWSRGGITRKGLERLRKALLRAGRASDLRLSGLKAERAEVLPGGLAILLALFDGLSIARMDVSQGALREGLLYDMVGRLRRDDPREQAVEAMARRHGVEARHAAAVQRTALSLLGQCARTWGLQGEEPRRLLGWAARLHEVGTSLSHTGHHKHGGYLLAHSDLRGFGRLEQQRLAALVRNHRRSVDEATLDALPRAQREPTLRLTALLRLAVRLSRGRTGRATLEAQLGARGRRLTLAFPRGWLHARPLTGADLEEEAGELRAAGLRLAVRTAPAARRRRERSRGRD